MRRPTFFFSTYATASSVAAASTPTLTHVAAFQSPDRAATTAAAAWIVPPHFMPSPPSMATAKASGRHTRGYHHGGALRQKQCRSYHTYRHLYTSESFGELFHNNNNKHGNTIWGGRLSRQQQQQQQQRRHFGSRTHFYLKSHKRSSSPDHDENEQKPLTTVKIESNDANGIDDIDEDDDDHNYQPSNKTIHAKSLAWIKTIVIGYNFCPFAERPLKENRLKLVVVRGNDDETIASTVVWELIARSDDEAEGTTIVVAPEYYPDDFTSYMSLVQYLTDEVMTEDKYADTLEGKVQIAPFHPQFEFEGSGPDGVDNYTNRSPYPMFHILREDEVADAVEKLGGDASRVWSRNVELLERMEERWGLEGVERVMMMRGEEEGEREKEDDGDYDMDKLLKDAKMAGYKNDNDS